MQVAHSLLVIKTVDEARRELVGLATSSSVDASGDIVEPSGATWTLPMPALWQHDAKSPIGWVTDAQITPAGIVATIKMAKITEPGTLKDRLDECWGCVKAGLVRGLSIGFQPIRSEPLKSGGRRFTAWAWKELSLVTLPCNADATVQAIRSADGLIRRQIAECKPGVVYLDGRRAPPPPKRGRVVHLQERRS